MTNFACVSLEINRQQTSKTSYSTKKHKKQQPNFGGGLGDATVTQSGVWGRIPQVFAFQPTNKSISKYLNPSVLSYGIFRLKHKAKKWL
ncbi:hypothetical protein FDUTEX481_01473 [Tolypothrix sp. PCC 7601]|nr:hypothetical protein FDUTEX481_01473 [Tolypothrix sp. PCC 7601]